MYKLFKKIQQALCRHKWELIKESKEILEFSDPSAEWYIIKEVKYKKCNKCGKIKR